MDRLPARHDHRRDGDGHRCDRLDRWRASGGRSDPGRGYGRWADPADPYQPRSGRYGRGLPYSWRRPARSERRPAVACLTEPRGSFRNRTVPKGQRAWGPLPFVGSRAPWPTAFGPLRPPSRNALEPVDAWAVRAYLSLETSI